MPSSQLYSKEEVALIRHGQQLLVCQRWFGHPPFDAAPIQVDFGLISLLLFPSELFP